MRTIHKLCTHLKRHEAFVAGTTQAVKCQECPAWEEDKAFGPVKRSCRVLAEEFLNVVKWGQPWGKKYRYSRRAWPERT